MGAVKAKELVGTVLEPGSYGFGTGGWRFWNRRLAVLEPGRLDSKNREVSKYFY